MIHDICEGKAVVAADLLGDDESTRMLGAGNDARVKAQMRLPKGMLAMIARRNGGAPPAFGGVPFGAAFFGGGVAGGGGGDSGDDTDDYDDDEVKDEVKTEVKAEGHAGAGAVASPAAGATAVAASSAAARHMRQDLLQTSLALHRIEAMASHADDMELIAAQLVHVLGNSPNSERERARREAKAKAAIATAVT